MMLAHLIGLDAYNQGESFNEAFEKVNEAFALHIDESRDYDQSIAPSTEVIDR